MSKEETKEVKEETKEETKEEVVEEAAEEKKEPSSDEIIEGLKAELDKAKNDVARAYADTENMKKRLQKDADATRKYRFQQPATEILPILDSMEMALKVQTEDEAIKHPPDIRFLHRQGSCANLHATSLLPVLLLHQAPIHLLFYSSAPSFNSAINAVTFSGVIAG